jgi:hypothetical protein
MSQEKAKHTPIWKRFFNTLFLPLKLPMYYAGCLTGFVLIAIILIGALAFGFSNNLMGGLDWMNQLFGSAQMTLPANIYIPDVERVQALTQLTTTSYNYADVQGGQRDMPAWLATLYGDSVVMVTVGIIEAGIDVSQISQEDIVFDETSKSLVLNLPSPTLQSCYLDENQSYIVERDTAAFGVPLASLEDTIRQRALLDYRDRAIEEGILDTARSEAEATMREFLGAVVGEDVNLIIQFDAPIPNIPLPATCQG